VRIICATIALHGINKPNVRDHPPRLREHRGLYQETGARVATPADDCCALQRGRRFETNHFHEEISDDHEREVARNGVEMGHLHASYALAGVTPPTTCVPYAAQACGGMSLAAVIPCTINFVAYQPELP